MKAANSNSAAGLRPYLPEDASRLAIIFRSAIMELTEDDYDEDQQEAWAALADDEDEFAARLAAGLTLVAVVEGEPMGFATLKDNTHIDLLYVDPEMAETGIARLLCDALERLAQARGAKALTVDASDTALGFFQHRGYVAQRRNSVPLGDVWLANTTLSKDLPPARTQ
ncbi:GNAT family N-acetyltransferase [Aquabacter sp. P-9]|uniref:GNAT family N-acetyltransferase n=1 Tax=Aquabacter sediminis TaxID=3029197 RepID=UPI00237E677A|nr:GNAT family N-acetyltransferase [Aquabacter sp. P-9]MDE1567329.1 GNAT family N-acetyltransferase [Aquabacter sp. P-9]